MYPYSKLSYYDNKYLYSKFSYCDNRLSYSKVTRLYTDNEKKGSFARVIFVSFAVTILLHNFISLKVCNDDKTKPKIML